MKKMLLGVLVFVSVGCGTSDATLGGNSEETLANSAGLSWEEFQTHVFREPETGVYIADGDTPFSSDKQLREFYELNVAQGQLIINRIGNGDDKWSDERRLNLTYCVSDRFGANKQKIVAAMASATGAWEAAANVKYVYVPAQDATCTSTNNSVLFDVNPVNVKGQYLARAFFPSNARASRNVLVDNTAFSSAGTSLVGVLRHELGHTLGFRHEHTRPEAGTCFEDTKWRALTPYDSASVMHYPQCNGTGSFSSLNLTASDKQGAAAVYGAPGANPNPNPNPNPGSTTESFNGSVALGRTNAHGPFSVTPGTTFTAVLSGTGDGDLYVRFGAAPTASAYACRPYQDGTAEECTLTVPAGAKAAFINVVGFAAATYTLKVTYAKPAALAGP